MRELCIHPAAFVDMDESIAFYEQRSPGKGLEFYLAVQQAFESVLKDPERWPVKFGIAQRYVMQNEWPFGIMVHRAGEPSARHCRGRWE